MFPLNEALLIMPDSDSRVSLRPAPLAALSPVLTPASETALSMDAELPPAPAPSTAPTLAAESNQSKAPVPAAVAALSPAPTPVSGPDPSAVWNKNRRKF